jgi:hypothetical protein
MIIFRKIILWIQIVRYLFAVFRSVQCSSKYEFDGRREQNNVYTSDLEQTNLLTAVFRKLLVLEKFLLKRLCSKFSTYATRLV